MHMVCVAQFHKKNVHKERKEKLPEEAVAKLKVKAEARKERKWEKKKAAMKEVKCIEVYSWLGEYSLSLLTLCVYRERNESLRVKTVPRQTKKNKNNTQ